MLALATRIKLFYLFHFAKPAADRQLYRAVYERKPKSILQIGLGDGTRTDRILESLYFSDPTQIPHLSVIDLFEACTDAPLSLKQAHRQFHAKVSRLRLIPGDPLSALSRAANSLGQFDLVLATAQVDAASMAKAWFYLPRIIHPQTVVIIESGCDATSTSFEILSAKEIEALAEKSRLRRAA